MPEIRSIDKNFLQRITEIIEENISKEQFGVSELADEVGMSRSNLLRRVKKLTNLSVSQFIRNVRLEHAREMMDEGIYTVSQVSYRVGFGSTSYFIKCFREYYGYPPGKTGEREIAKENEDKKNKSGTQERSSLIVIGVFVLVVLLGVFLFVFIKPLITSEYKSEKSIAVLPFKNDSSDSVNMYFVNGLMESTLNNLQKIQDLRVISRTSVEKYRDSRKTSPEIASELDVNYLVEGSGQKIGDQILLNIQLIDAKNDKQLWAEQYNRESRDIFSLQSEVAKNIAAKIQVIISPEVKKSIDKIPTGNMQAYDIFLKGIDLLNKGLPENAKQSIPYLRKAIEMDPEFARAYAAIAIAYYTIDENQPVKQYSDSVNYFSDRAMFFDSKLPQSLIAKALFYMLSREYELAVPYLEKALEYNPNSDLVFAYLLDLYANHIPNTEKYLEYALRGLRIDISSYDSTIASFNYLHIANAFIQAGFQEQAEKYIDKSLVYKPDNLYSQYTKAYILFAKSKDLRQTKDLLLEVFGKDTTRLDIMQEVGKIYYYLRDYDNAYKYYKRFVNIRNTYHLNIYGSENAKVGFVYLKMGNSEEGKKLLEEFRDYAENDHSQYRHSGLALYYSYKGEKEKAVEHLNLFSNETGYFYWTVLFLPIEPLFDNIKESADFSKITSEIESNFKDWHNRIKNSLGQEGLLKTE